MRKKAIAIIIVFGLLIIGYNYIYKDHRDISKENPDFKIEAANLVNEFGMDVALSQQKYLDKTIVVSGVITELNEIDMTIDDAVFCQFQNRFEIALNVGDQVIIKGRCIGFDDLLEQVKLSECFFNK